MSRLQTIIGEAAAPPPFVDEPPPFDPLRAELAEAIRLRAERADAVAVARKAAERLQVLVEKVEKRQPTGNIYDDGPDEDVVRLVETARNRNPEMLPATPSRLARAAASEELTVAREALSLGVSRRAQADAALVEINERIEGLISQLFSRDLPRRVADTKRAHDDFLAKAKVLGEIAGDLALLPGDLASIVRDMRDRGEEFAIPFDPRLVDGPVQKWEAARKALRESAHAFLPD